MATSMKEADYVGVHHITKAAAREMYVQHASRAQQRGVPIPWTHLELVPQGRAALYRSARAAVRVLVKAVWLFPLLLIPKLVLRLMHVWYGDLITVAFVLLVVVTFGSLSLLSLLHLLAGSRSQREANAKLTLQLPSATTLTDAAPLLAPIDATLGLPAATLGLPDATLGDVLAQIAHGSAQAGAGDLRVRGTVDAGLARGEPVLSERWVDDNGVVVRVVSGVSFALDVAGAPPLVVELAASPTLLGPYAPALDGLPPAAAWAAAAKPWVPAGASPPPLEQAPACVIRQGDVVELLASHATSVDLAEVRIGGREPRFVQSVGGPYRGERTPAILVRCSVESPMAIASAGGASPFPGSAS